MFIGCQIFENGFAVSFYNLCKSATLKCYTKKVSRSFSKKAYGGYLYIPQSVYPIIVRPIYVVVLL